MAKKVITKDKIAAKVINTIEKYKFWTKFYSVFIFIGAGFGYLASLIMLMGAFASPVFLLYVLLYVIASTINLVLGLSLQRSAKALDGIEEDTDDSELAERSVVALEQVAKFNKINVICTIASIVLVVLLIIFFISLGASLFNDGYESYSEFNYDYNY